MALARHGRRAPPGPGSAARRAAATIGVLATRPVDESSTRHGSSATSSGTVAVRGRAGALQQHRAARSRAKRLATLGELVGDHLAQPGVRLEDRGRARRSRRCSSSRSRSSSSRSKRVSRRSGVSRMYWAWISDRSNTVISRSRPRTRRRSCRMTWITSSMLSERDQQAVDQVQPVRRACAAGTRCAGGRPRRGGRRRPAAVPAGRAVRGWPSTSATLLMPNDSSIGVSRYSSSSTASGWKPFLTSMTRCRPRCRSVRSFTSAIPASFFAPHQVLDLGDDLLRADVVGQLGDDDPGAARGDLLDPWRSPRVRKMPRPVSYASRDCRPGRRSCRRSAGRGRGRTASARRGRRPGGRSGAAPRRSTSPRLCGGHVGGHADRDARRAVDQQVGQAGGQDLGLGPRCRRSWAGSRRCPRRSRPPSSMAAAVSRPRCTAWRQAGRRCRASRSSRARRPAAAASRTAAPSGPARRRSPRRRAGAAGPSPRRPRGRT